MDAEKYEGWEVAPGKIAYNHVGYKQNHSKVALASGLSASLFQLRDARSGKVVLTKPVNTVKNDRGEFQKSGNQENTSFGPGTAQAGLL